MLRRFAAERDMGVRRSCGLLQGRLWACVGGARPSARSGCADCAGDYVSPGCG